MHPKPDEDELHVTAGLILLIHRRITHLLILMYHRSKNQEFLDNRNLPTRQFDKVKFTAMNPSVKKAFRSPNYLGAQYWDMLPFETQSSATIQEFKHKINRHVREGLFTV